MRLTRKVKHGLDLKTELEKARKVAVFAIENRDKLSTKHVKHIGLNASIANQVIRKYGLNRRAKIVSSIVLPIKARDTRMTKDGLYIIPLKSVIPFHGKVAGQIELGSTYAHVPVEVREQKQYKPKKIIGVDLNTTGHSAVVAVGKKIYKLGKAASHTHRKYSTIRKNMQRLGHYGVVKKIGKRESNIMRDINHKTSRYIVNIAKKNKAQINLEDLRGIKGRRVKKSFRHALHSWGFYQLRTFIEYKSLLAGVPVVKIEPAYTSKVCSRCGLLGTRNGKSFKCPSGHVEHADANAAFNIASPKYAQLYADSVAYKRTSDSRQMAPA